MDVPRHIARSRIILGSMAAVLVAGISGCNTFALEPSDFAQQRDLGQNVSVQPLVRSAAYAFAAAKRRKPGYVVRRVLFRSGSAAARCWFHGGRGTGTRRHNREPIRPECP